MKIDFSKIETKDIDGTILIGDMATTLGKVMYKTAILDEEMEFGAEIYNKKIIDVNAKRASIIKKYLTPEQGFVACFRKAIIPILDDIIEKDEDPDIQEVK